MHACRRVKKHFKTAINAAAAAAKSPVGEEEAKAAGGAVALAGVHCVGLRRARCLRVCLHAFVPQLLPLFSFDVLREFETKGKSMYP